MVVALASGQPVAHMCDLLGIPREWPALFEVLGDMADETMQGLALASQQMQRQALAEAAKRRHGG